MIDKKKTNKPTFTTLSDNVSNFVAINFNDFEER